jgi:hypothetical protein
MNDYQAARHDAQNDLLVVNWPVMFHAVKITAARLLATHRKDARRILPGSNIRAGLARMRQRK